MVIFFFSSSLSLWLKFLSRLEVYAQQSFPFGWGSYRDYHQRSRVTGCQWVVSARSRWAPLMSQSLTLASWSFSSVVCRALSLLAKCGIKDPDHSQLRSKVTCTTFPCLCYYVSYFIIVVVNIHDVIFYRSVIVVVVYLIPFPSHWRTQMFVRSLFWVIVRSLVTWLDYLGTEGSKAVDMSFTFYIFPTSRMMWN